MNSKKTETSTAIFDFYSVVANMKPTLMVVINPIQIKAK